jgi:hypothetical protein
VVITIAFSVMNLSNCPIPGKTCFNLKQVIPRGFARILVRTLDLLRLVSNCAPHKRKKTAQIETNRHPLKIKKPENTTFYRLLKKIDQVISGPYDTILEPLSF